MLPSIKLHQRVSHGAREEGLFSHVARAALRVHPASPDLSKLGEQLGFMKLSLSELTAVVQSGRSVLPKSPLT